MSAPPTDGVVVLREPRDGDVPAMVEGCRDPLTRRYTAKIPDPYGPEDARTFLALQAEWREQGTEWHFAIADPATDELLGMTGVIERFRLHADVENVASHRVAERAGFVRQPGVVRERIGGAERDAVAYVR